MRKKNKKCLVFSVYSPDLDDYPYFPFIGKNISEGIHQYIKFIDKKNQICANPQLHIIGEATIRFGCIENVIPTLFPQRVDFNTHLIGTLHALSCYYVEKIKNYLERLFKDA